MSDTRSIEMDAEERDAFLGIGGTGVISFSGEDESPHSVPVSYGYDDADSTFYFRLAIGPESEKGDVAGRHVTFVVYGREDDGWRSVIVKGRLEETTEESAAVESLQGLEEVHIPLVDIFGQPVKDVQFGFYRLVPDELSSRAESNTPL